jgi:two-component system chemotaxis response regulator CheB
VEALTRMAAKLPPDLPYPLLVVLHLPPNAPSVLAGILSRSGPLPAVPAVNGAALQPGHIHVCIPDHHLLIDDHRMMLSQGPTENQYRPAINALFRSVAVAFGPNAIGVLLSGVLDDGVLGLATIRARGGTTIVQRPDDASYPTMPLNAICAGIVDHQSAAADLGALLQRLADRQVDDRHTEPDFRTELENRIAMGGRFDVPVKGETLGPPSGYTCPDCNGSLMTVTEGSYRCHVGHAWTGESLLTARDDEVEAAIWVALRSLQEKVNLSRRLADKVGPGVTGDRYARIADEAEKAMLVLGKRLAQAPPNAGSDAG